MLKRFIMASPDIFTPVTCAQCEPALICEESGGPMADLPILVLSHKRQTSCTVLNCEHRSSRGGLSSCHHNGVCVGHFGQKYAHQETAASHFPGLWPWSFWSSSHKGADTSPAAWLMPFYSPVLLSLCSSQSPGISSVLLRVC